mmetsp:Transcript_10434/g.19043  ORF Transcript_10434/g.19043 Transcript_10434/m.19043 type:complete len:176 (+) Transcript_10434:283-810(+)
MDTNVLMDTNAPDAGATAKAYEIIVQGILNSKSDVNKALRHAVKNYAVEIVKLLIQHKADVNTRNARDETVLMSAVREGGAKRGFPAKSRRLVNPLRDLSRKVQCLVEYGGADVNFRTPNGDTAIIRAAQHDNIDIVLYLLERNAEVITANMQGLSIKLDLLIFFSLILFQVKLP